MNPNETPLGVLAFLALFAVACVVLVAAGPWLSRHVPRPIRQVAARLGLSDTHPN